MRFSDSRSGFSPPRAGVHLGQRSTSSLIASTALDLGLVADLAGMGAAGTDDAPLPTCTLSPVASDQGDDVVVRGRRWDPGSTVTIAFNDDASDDDGSEGDDDLTDDSTLDPTPNSTPDAERGTHSVDVTGLDQDGLAAHCARTLRLDDHPEADGATDDTTGTSQGTAPSGTTDTTGGSTPTTAATSSTSSTSP